MHKFNIPSKINVGFQKREDTYTGKLAYVVYTDDKGVLRKEKSWNGWRNKNIAAQEFENVPTEGFVLNKKVGETRWGWNPRKAWVRVYDPRDFEFEISVANLVFILEECSSIKGKGLEGEFVYAWDRAELLLLPVNSKEYRDSVSYKKALQDKVTKKDMKEGCCYLNKEGEEVMYLGRHPFWRWHHNSGKIEFKSQKKHIFAYITKNDDTWYEKDWYVQAGFTKIISKLGDDPSPLFAEKFEEFKKSKYGSGPVKLAKKKKGDYEFIAENDEYYHVNDVWGWNQRDRTDKSINPVKIVPGKSVIVPLESTRFPKNRVSDDRFALSVVNEAGKRIKMGEYYYG